MLYRDNEVLIFDEPTAVLTPQEIEELMEIMRGLTREGKSILFISHKLNEIMEVSDRVTVLRKGRYVGTVDTSATTQEELSRMMVGQMCIRDSAGGTDDLAQRFGAGAVPQRHLDLVLLGPASVSIHDDGHMPGQAVEVDLRVERCGHD